MTREANSEAERLDMLNILLIIVSFAFAVIFPFELFLLAYAILGPLHYLTEINWIDKKGYFLENKRMIFLPFLFAFLVFIPKLASLNFMSHLLDINWFNNGISIVDEYSNGFIFLWLFTVIAITITKKKVILLYLMIIGVLLAYLFNNLSIYQQLVGLFVPTLLHVFVFTAVFMLYGAVRNASRPGYLSVVLMVLAPLVLAIFPFSVEGTQVSEVVRDTFIAGNFPKANAQLAGILGISSGDDFSFDRGLDIKFQMFIAFAYTYHYLNWFTKTTVIGWHRSLTGYRVLMILVIWISSVVLYYIDYGTGLIWLISLSILHVFLEFPLNLLSIKWLFSRLVIGD